MINIIDNIINSKLDIRNALHIESLIKEHNIEVRDLIEIAFFAYDMPSSEILSLFEAIEDKALKDKACQSLEDAQEYLKLSCGVVG